MAVISSEPFILLYDIRCIFLPVIHSAAICIEFHLPFYHQLLSIVRFFKFVLLFTLLNSFISKLYHLTNHLLFQILYLVHLAAQTSGKISAKISRRKLYHIFWSPYHENMLNHARIFPFIPVIQCL